MGLVNIAEALRIPGLAPLDARVLLRHVLHASDALIAAHPERELGEDERSRYLDLVERRQAGEPVAYLTGEREFYSLAFQVTPAVLIPRPETELLVDLALERARGRQRCRVLDLATGSGCVAVAIARNTPHAQVTASDVSREALALARENAARHGVALELLTSDWFEAVAGRRFDVIVANPPYIAATDPHFQEGDTRFEPRHALVAGPTGYEGIERIVRESPRHLEPGGWLLFEHGYEQGARCRELLVACGYAAVASERDLAGHERVTSGRLTPLRSGQ